MSTWVEIALGLIKGVPWHPKGSSSRQEIALKTRGFPTAPNAPGCRPQRRPCIAAHPSWWPKLNVSAYGGVPKRAGGPRKGFASHLAPYVPISPQKRGQPAPWWPEDRASGWWYRDVGVMAPTAALGPASHGMLRWFRRLRTCLENNLHPHPNERAS